MIYDRFCGKDTHIPQNPAPATTIYHPKKVQEKNRSGLDLTAGMVYFLEVSIC